MSTTKQSDPQHQWARPDGLDSAYYERFRGFGLEKLAWEFLRRSEAFEAACDSVEAGTADAKTVASKWGLYKFKHYQLGFKLGGTPRFLPTLVRYFPNLTDKALRQQITLQPGHVAFVLNAGALLDYTQARDGQRKRLWRRLEKYVERIASSHDAKPKQLQLKEANYLKCLQLLDLLHAKASPAEIKQRMGLFGVPARKPQPGGKSDQYARIDSADRLDADHRYHTLKKQAVRLANEGYLELAVVGAARREETPKKTRERASEKG
jgi:hypothetical protein